jgi:4-amino-4-deoxy-L-arabinose transferase-like glycosyltransferase
MKILLARVARGEVYPAMLAAAFALVAALAFLAILPAGSRVNDSADYAEFYAPVAHSLLAGQGLADDGALAARYPPGFPVALAAAIGGGRIFGVSEDMAVRLLCLLGFAATAVSLFRLGRACHSPLAGLVAAAAFSVYPPHLFLVKQPNSELFFLPPLLLGLELAWRARLRSEGWRLALLAGAFFGLAALVRPIALLLFVPLGAFVFFFPGPIATRSRRWALAAALAGGQLMVMAPWVIYVHSELGRWIPLSTGGRLSMLDGLTIAAKKDRQGPPMPEPVAELMREIDRSRPELKSPGAVVSFLGEKALAEPGTVAQLLLVKTARSFYATDSLRYEGFLLALQVPFLLTAAAAVFAAWRRTEPWRPLAVLTLLLLLYFLAMTVMVLSILRYMVPALAVVFVLLGARAAEIKAGRLSSVPGDPS